MLHVRRLAGTMTNGGLLMRLIARPMTKPLVYWCASLPFSVVATNRC